MATVFRAGQSVEDLCRACKESRDHRVIAVDLEGRILRVICGYCGSQHNYRGHRNSSVSRPTYGESANSSFSRPTFGGSANSSFSRPTFGGSANSRSAPPAESRLSRPVYQTDRESDVSSAGLTDQESAALLQDYEGNSMDLEALLRRVIREEAGLTPTPIAKKWRGGTMVLRPAEAGLQEKVLPLDALFNKVVMIRNRLRVLEQQVNAGDLPEDQKLKLQGYITGCYGSLTTFNVLFADEDDKFRGTGD